MCAADKEFNMGRRKAAQCTVNKSPQEDFSVLREPLHISTKGVMQLVKCMQSGTTEVRSMLQYECEVILECKVCRSLFRGFMNFLAHKRVYCTELQQNVRLNVRMEEQKDDETIVVQPESPPDHKQTIVHDVNAAETGAVVGDETKTKCLTQGNKDDDGDSADNEKMI